MVGQHGCRAVVGLQFQRLGHAQVQYTALLDENGVIGGLVG